MGIHYVSAQAHTWSKILRQQVSEQPITTVLHVPLYLSIDHNISHSNLTYLPAQTHSLKASRTYFVGFFFKQTKDF